MNKIKYKQVKLFFNLCSDNSSHTIRETPDRIIIFQFANFRRIVVFGDFLFFVIARTRTLRAFFHAQQVIQMFYFDYQPVTQAY